MCIEYYLQWPYLLGMWRPEGECPGILQCYAGVVIKYYRNYIFQCKDCTCTVKWCRA